MLALCCDPVNPLQAVLRHVIPGSVWVTDARGLRRPRQIPPEPLRRYLCSPSFSFDAKISDSDIKALSSRGGGGGGAEIN